MNTKRRNAYSAAGIVPITYAIDSNGSVEWHILLSVEHRWKENKMCIHPLAGVKEQEDNGRPLKTAVREFHEESIGVFQSVKMEEKVRLSIMKGHCVYYKKARLHLFCVVVPYIPDVHRLSLEAKARSTAKTFSGRVDGSELFWYPLDSFIKQKGQVSLTVNDEVITPSTACRHWYRGGQLLRILEMVRKDTATDVEASRVELVVKSVRADILDLTLQPL